MRVDGFNPYNTLPDRGNRPVAPVAPGESVRAGQAATAVETSPSKALTPRSVTASTANAEYIPARRDSSMPSQTFSGPGSQAMAAYQSTASMPVEETPEGIYGIDLYA
ncbi:hypothetical protein [Halopseudomonas salegens]|uniref:Uncharacterized protein n=1 Tax=Halopseudomonas salegens TaxID=1434072 RepID=A0A1H2EF25_9GAMM|nr:hypothetical protein [Halopseudomonas salegens]SDT93691.1 hypothetical protein SAMN05216210_0657 [Halopseudomonas salegens]